MKYMKNPIVQSVFSGLRPAVVGLLGAAALLLMNAENFYTPADPWRFWISVSLFVFTFVVTKWLNINPIKMIGYAAFGGLMLLY
jgi:chromate transporter